MRLGLGLSLGSIFRGTSVPFFARFDSGLITFDNGARTMDQDVDSAPDAFSIPAITDAELDTVYESDPVQLEGMNAPASFTAPGGSVVVGETDLGSSGTVPANAAFKAALRSSAANSTPIELDVTIGGVSAPFIITTRAPAPAPTPTPTPTPPETLMTRRGGAPDYIVTNGSNSAAGGLGKAMADALTAMQSDGQRKVIAMQGGLYGDVFPGSGKNYPAQLDIINLDDANPAEFHRFEVNSQQNILIDGLYVNYIPSAYSSPVVIVRNSTNVQLHNHKNIGQSGRGRRLQILGGTDVTIYRANIKGGGDQLLTIAQKESTTIPTVNPRVIESNLEDGDTDGFRIFGAQNFYLARNFVHNILQRDPLSHNDGAQVTQHATDALKITSSGKCIGHLHYGQDATHLIEGWQMTNAFDTGNPVSFGDIWLEDFISIGTTGAGIAIRAADSATVKNCRAYQTAYGGTDPTLAILGSLNVYLLGDNRAYGGLTTGAFGGRNSDIVQNDGVTGFHDPAMLLDDAQIAAQIASWRAANPGVPT